VAPGWVGSVVLVRPIWVIWLVAVLWV